MKLIANWRQAWRMFSVQAQVVAIAVMGAWQYMSPDLKEVVPPWAVLTVAMVLLVAGIIGRLIVQPAIRAEP